MMRALPLQEFSIFDFDAYGSPWEHVIILCARRQVQPGERLGLVLTLKLRFGAFDDALATLVGFQRSGFAGLGRAYGYIARSRPGSDQGAVARSDRQTL